MARRHDIDVLRAAAFLLLIVYHVGMVYVADWSFHFKSSHQWEWVQWPMLAVNRWRMPLIFLVSGLALGLARPERAPLAFGLRRTLRLVLPLVFGMLAVVPVQAYVEAVGNGAVEPGFAAFMGRYLQLRPWPGGGFTGAEFGVTWNHLWYLAYLWVYTLVLLVAIAVGRSLSGLGGLGVRRLRPTWWPVVLLVPTAYFLGCLFFLAPRFPTTHALFDDWFSHAYYFPILVFGYVAVRSDGFWSGLQRTRWWTLALGACGLLVFLGLHALGRDPTAGPVPASLRRILSLSAQALYMWAMLLTILAFAHRWLNRPFRWLPWANEAVYPWYILHQSIIVPLAFILAPLSLAGGVEAGLVLTGTTLGCAVLHEAVIRRSRALRPLFGLKRLERHAAGGVARTGGRTLSGSGRARVRV